MVIEPGFYVKTDMSDWGFVILNGENEGEYLVLDTSHIASQTGFSKEYEGTGLLTNQHERKLASQSQIESIVSTLEFQEKITRFKIDQVNQFSQSKPK
jgi:hypothetical protein